mmetsp:Transcript_1738/g.3265  ORF Transcript_1738/g.3265 Transcript_1738/m.3265 type:complete len:122 (-) Transcript_1738:1348-1713(-)
MSSHTPSRTWDVLAATAALSSSRCAERRQPNPPAPTDTATVLFCTTIWQAFSRAMRAGLYDSVAVKGSEKPLRAYACTNRMEFFAELSVAYLWGQQHYSSAEHKENKEEDEDDPSLPFNKW